MQGWKVDILTIKGSARRFFTMSGVYKCKKCQETHSPPTGRKCNRDNALDTAPDPITAALSDLKDSLSSIEQRLTALEQKSDAGTGASESESDCGSSLPGATAGEGPSTKSMRKDQSLQEKVAERLGKTEVTVRFTALRSWWLRLRHISTKKREEKKR